MAALLLALSTSPASADDPNALADRLAQIQQQQAQQLQHLHDLEAEQSQVRASLALLQAELAQSTQDLAPVSTQVEQLEAQIAAAESAIDADQRIYEEHLSALGQDLRRIYAFEGSGWLQFVFSARSFGDLLDRTIYLDQFALSEYKLATQLKEERNALQSQRRLLSQERDQLAPLVALLQQRVSSAANALAVTSAYDSKLDAQRRSTMIALVGLQAKGKALQKQLDDYLAEQAQQFLKNPNATYGTSCPSAAPVGSVRFCGHGWGHGVGMGQWGADGMALSGIGYRQIVQHFYSGSSWAALDTSNTPIHVGVLWGTGPYRVVPSGPAELLAAGRTISLSPGQAVTASPTTSLQEIRPLSPATHMAVYGPHGLYHHYRGTIVTQPSNGIVYVINVLSIEDYLRGLGEVPSSWPIEAIKAQIVAARCYALTHLGSTSLYDVDDTTAFQVYRGVDAESDRQNAAVDQTAGQVLTYAGRVILAFFSASDGGHTANVSDVFGGSLATYPYLRGVIDPWDVVAPRHTWYTGVYSYSTLERVYFTSSDVSTYGHLKGIDLSDRDSSDRLNTVGLIGQRGTKRMGVSLFMRAFNHSSLTGQDVLWNEMFGTTPSNSWPYW